VKNLEFDADAFEDLAWWIESDRKKALKIIKLIRNLKVAIAKNPQTSASILFLLGNNWHEYVRMAVAANDLALPSDFESVS
jgi:hypothetical protein